MNKRVYLLVSLLFVCILIYSMFVSAVDSTPICTDTDGGINYNVVGFVNYTSGGHGGSGTDTCEGNTLIEFYCNLQSSEVSSDGSIIPKQKLAYTCPNGCSNGACIASIQSPICTDTDGGKNEFVAGSTKGESVFPDEGITSKSDYCIQKINGTFELDYSVRDPYKIRNVNECKIDCAVQEYGCSESTIISDIINCPYGCKDGACLSNSIQVPTVVANATTTCTDSDGGINYSVVGTVNYTSGPHSGTGTDSCEGGILVESYCNFQSNETTSGGYMIPKQKIGYACPYGCLNGACLSSNMTLIAPEENPIDMPTGENKTTTYLCQGCELDTKCYPFGYRKSGEFCSDTGTFVEQSKGDVTCDNNFECTSNVCVSSKCVSPSFIESIINWFKKLFGG